MENNIEVTYDGTKYSYKKFVLIAYAGDNVDCYVSNIAAFNLFYAQKTLNDYIEKRFGGYSETMHKLFSCACSPSADDEKGD